MFNVSLASKVLKNKGLIALLFRRSHPAHLLKRFLIKFKREKAVLILTPWTKKIFFEVHFLSIIVGNYCWRVQPLFVGSSVLINLSTKTFKHESALHLRKQKNKKIFSFAKSGDTESAWHRMAIQASGTKSEQSNSSNNLDLGRGYPSLNPCKGWRTKNNRWLTIMAEHRYSVRTTRKLGGY